VKEKHKQMYMRMASAAALTSSAVRLKVGAVAVKNNMVIGTGYNALPRGIDGSCEKKIYSSHPFLFPNEEFPLLCTEYREGKFARHRLETLPEVRHAEANLILNLAKSTESSTGATIFCTHACCKFCAMDIVDAGIKKFYYKEAYRDLSGVEYLKQNGVEVEQI
jgi:dCMP deaminase